MKISAKGWCDFRGYVAFPSNCCYRIAEPPEVVLEVVGWDGIDPFPELPLFHSTMEGSFGGSLHIFEEPAIFCLEGWRAFMRYHRADDEAPVQEAPVLARFRSFLVRFMEKTGKRWSCPSPVRCYCSNSEQSSPVGSPSRWSRGRSLLWLWTVGHNLSSVRG